MTLPDGNHLITRLCSDLVFDVPVLTAGLPESMAAHWQALPAKRQVVYRRLVFSNVHEIVTYVFRQTSRFLGESVWEHLLRRFLAESQIRSEHFYNIPRDFWGFAQDARVFDLNEMPFLQNLADYEFTRWSLYQAINTQTPASLSLDTPLLAAKLVFNPDLVLKAYDWAVDEIKADSSFANLKPVRRLLLLYRTQAERVVETLVLNPSAFAFLEFCWRHPDDSLQNLLENFDANFPNLPESWVSDVPPFLQELLQRGIVVALT